MRIILRNLSNTLHLFAALCFLYPVGSVLHAQTPVRRLVQLSCACADDGGKDYFRAVQERLTASPSFEEVNEKETNSGDVIRVEITSHYLQPTGTNSFGRTAIEVTCFRGDTTLHQEIEICEHLPIADCADYIIGALCDM